MTITVRFAPSPTGLLHIGNVRTALLNWLYAKSNSGKFILRLDDTDKERSKEEYADAIKQDLEWLGLKWDRVERQSDRLERYSEVVEKLKADGKLYACYETPEELEFKRRRQRARGKPPVYDRAGLTLSDEKKAEYEAEGRKPHYRFLLEHEIVKWDDMVRGECRYDCTHQSDPVVIREDGSLLYMLPSVIDDADFGITHVIRGEDHVTNTAVQIQMFRLLGNEAPVFGHPPLITGLDGKLSKRTGSLSVQDLRKSNVEPSAITSLLSKLGTSESVEPCTIEELAASFDISAFGRAQPKFDASDIDAINRRVIHNMSFEKAKAKLSKLGFENVDEIFWNAVRPNLEKITDISIWWEICRGDIVPVIEDKTLTDKAADLLPPEPWDDKTWKTWTKLVQEETNRKGKNLFHPIRLALTGFEKGPELKVLLPLIGRKHAIDRLKGNTA